MEARGRQELSTLIFAERAWFLYESSRQLFGLGSDLSGHPRPSDAAHDVRFHRERTSHDGLPYRSGGGSGKGDESPGDQAQSSKRTLQYHALSNDAQYWRCDHGRQSQEKRG